MDVAALREELVVIETRKKGAAQMFARGTIDAEQLESITAELDTAIARVRGDLSAATAKSPLADFAATSDGLPRCIRCPPHARCRTRQPQWVGWAMAGSWPAPAPFLRSPPLPQQHD